MFSIDFQRQENRGEKSIRRRIDKMKALRTQHMTDMNAAMDKRDQATKTLYAALSPEQQKVFDSEHARMGKQRR